MKSGLPLCAVLAFVSILNATPYTFAIIDPFGSNITDASGINNSGQIVGSYGSNPRYGYLLSGGVFTTIEFPGSTYTEVFNINDSGQIVGRYFDSSATSHGFLLSGGAYTSIDYPGSTFTSAGGINDSGQIVGTAEIGGVDHAFLLSGGVFSIIDPAGTTSAGASGINNNGQIVGGAQFTGVTQDLGFELTDGQLTGSIDIFAGTGFSGINDAGQVVGTFFDPGYQTSEGLIWTEVQRYYGTHVVFDVPGAISTSLGDINNSGMIVGTISNDGASRGFLAVPAPEQGNFPLNLAALSLLGAWRWRAKVCKSS
jgi:probable HAF family extracellular repeat protein